MRTGISRRMRSWLVGVLTLAAGLGLALAFVTPATAATPAAPTMRTVAAIAPAAAGHTATNSTTASPSTTAGTASPAAVPTNCTVGYFCFWVNSEFTGDEGYFAGNNANWGDYAESQCKSGTWNDCASSAWNDGQSDSVIVYQNINYGGGSFCFPLHTYVDNFASSAYAFSNGASLNDAVSSNKWYPSATGC